MFTRLRGSIVPPLLFIYLLLVLLVIALLVRDRDLNKPSFVLATSEHVDTLDKNVLELHGENFHSDIKGVFSKGLLNEEALLWHQYTDVPFRSVEMNGNFGLASLSGNTAVSLSFPEGGDLRLLDSIDLPGNVSQIEITGRKALLGMTKGGGVSLVDIGDPMNLKLIANYPFPGSVLSMVSEDGVAYFAGKHIGVARLDLEEENPAVENLATLDFPWRMDIQGERLAVGTLNGRVHLFDVNRSGALSEVDVLDFTAQIRGVAFTKQSLAVALLDGTVAVFDLSTWPELTQSGRLTLPAQPIEMKRGAGDEQVAVAMIAAGLGLLDIKNKETPIMQGWFKVPKTYKDFIVYPEKILGTSNEGLDLISVQEMESGEMSRLAQEAVITKTQYELKEWNRQIYGYDSQGEVEAIGIATLEPASSDRFMPIVDGTTVSLYEQDENGQLLSVGSVQMNEKALAARFHGSTLYVSYNGGLRVFSATAPEEMSVVYDLKIPGIVHCFEPMKSEVLLVSTRHQGFLVFDIRKPGELKQIARLELPSHLRDRVVRDILIDGQRAYLSLGESGLYIVDMSSPHQPEILQMLDTPGYANAMALRDDFLYISDGMKGIYVVDVKDRARALSIGSLPVPSRVLGMAAADDGLIVNAHRWGTMKLPLLQRLEDIKIVSDEVAFVEVPSVEKGQSVYLYDDRASVRVDLTSH